VANIIPNEKEYTVVMRGPSSVIFGQNETLRAENFPSSAGPVTIVYATRWIRKNDAITIPGHLWIEIKGKGKNLEEVLTPFANAAFALLPILSLSANAAIDDPDLELGFDSSPESEEREYFQHYIPPESEIVHFARLINIKETVAVIGALTHNIDAERLRRASNQYRLALDSWILGREALSLAHLWMALEALTKSRIRSERIKRALETDLDLANHLGIDLKHLDATIRRDFILKGDKDCYKKSKQASDGFEHGFLGYDTIQDLAKDTRHRMAQYIRTEIFEQLRLPQDTHSRLTNDPFDSPMGYWPMVKYIRGKLIGKGSQLAAEGNAYPFIRWKPVLNKCEVTEDGRINIEANENFTAELGQGIVFQPESYEAWRPE
jgi:hypothetical protein